MTTPITSAIAQAARAHRAGHRTVRDEIMRDARAFALNDSDHDALDRAEEDFRRDDDLDWSTRWE